ncbi:MAG: trehalose-6-phosphate synthase, partial [Candidatus Obscuribacterales bacterium]|nr:trehalose-6-phosphate synthase [Candidatus Obscuribacterales bacterium]
EYADNFARFVNDHMAESSVVTFRRDRESRLRAVDSVSERKPAGRLRGLVRNNMTQKVSRIFVAPLGLDLDYWNGMSRSASSFDQKLSAMGLGRDSFVLSVDRADYTKGIFERIKAIDVFFCKYPHWVGMTKFVQICGRTRSGLSAFDQYWSKCRSMAESVNKRHGTESWDPIVWIDTPMNPEMLAGCYRNAQVMLVNPVRDGLNLTAKEFFACQTEDPGVLVLSPGAGAYHEVGEQAVFADPHNSDQLADSIEQSLRMPRLEREARARQVMSTLSGSTLNDWCLFFSGRTAAATGQAARQIESYREKRYARYIDRVDPRTVVLAKTAEGGTKLR